MLPLAFPSEQLRQSRENGRSLQHPKQISALAIVEGTQRKDNCCVVTVCSACNALSKNFPQMFSCFAVVIVANDLYISTILVQPCCSLMQSLGSVVVVLNVRFTTNGMCVKNNTHIYVAQAIIE